jgi:hypothetical protein
MPCAGPVAQTSCESPPSPALEWLTNTAERCDRSARHPTRTCDRRHPPTWWTGSCWHDINLHLDVSAQYTLAKAIGTTREQLMGNLRDLALLLAPSSMVM